MAAPDEKPSPSDPKSNWINNLAQRSAGLPTERPSPRKTSGEEEKSLWSLAGLGVQFAVTVGVLAYLGILLDRKLNSSPWGLVVLVTLGTIGNLYLLVKQALSENHQKPPGTKERSNDVRSSDPDRSS